MNWLITGGCGFIGSSLIRYLRERGEDAHIRIVDNLSVGTRDDLAAVTDFRDTPADTVAPPPAPDGVTVELVVGDILDEALALKATEGFDAIVHLAANTGVAPSVANPRLDCMTNVVGLLNYLEGARINQVPRFVLASSGGTVIGECEPPINEEMVPHPVSPYGASKSAGEGYCSAYFGTFGIQTTALRFGNVYGPGSSHKNSVVAKFLRRALNQEILEIYGDGKQTRDFIYIDDLLGAIYKAATVPDVGGEVFQIATSAETTVNEIADKLLTVLDDLGVHGVEVRHANPLPGEIRRNYADTSKAARMLGWQPEVALDDGLRRTAQWFIERLETA